jgi:cobalt/nickel transport system permease protein
VALRKEPKVVVTARHWLVAYLAAVVAVTFIHAPVALAGLLAIAMAGAGARRWQILKKTLLAVLAFNLTVSAGYALVTLWRGGFSGDYLLLANLRVLLLVFLGFWFVHRVDLLAALSGWPTLTLIATLALGQIRTLERIAADFRLAFESRNIARPRLAARIRHAAAQGITLTDKSVASATESALAMRSRAAFDA